MKSKKEKVSIGLFERIADDDPQYLEKLRKKSDKWSNVACVFGVITVIIEAVIFFFRIINRKSRQKLKMQEQWRKLLLQSKSDSGVERR